MDSLRDFTVALPRPQVLAQLWGDELKACLDPLQAGRLGLEVPDFAGPWVLDGEWEKRLQHYKRLCASIGGPITLHGPFLDLNPASPEPRLVALTKKRYRHALEIAKALNAEVIVFHTNFNPNLRHPRYPERWQAKQVAFWYDMLPMAEASNITIVLENMWDPSPEPLAALLEEVDHARLKACLDTGHAHLFSRVELSEWVQRLGDHLTYVHLTDNQGEWDQELALGDGDVDLLSCFSAFDRNQLPWMVIEVATYEKLVSSLNTLGWESLLSGDHLE